MYFSTVFFLFVLCFFRVFAENSTAILWPHLPVILKTFMYKITTRSQHVIMGQYCVVSLPLDRAVSCNPQHNNVRAAVCSGKPSSSTNNQQPTTNNQQPTTNCIGHAKTTRPNMYRLPLIPSTTTHQGQRGRGRGRVRHARRVMIVWAKKEQRHDGRLARHDCVSARGNSSSLELLPLGQRVKNYS